MNKTVIKCNNETFSRAEYNGISILVRDSDGYVNATKMARDSGIKSKREHFSRFMNGDRWTEICEYFEAEYHLAEIGAVVKNHYIMNEGVPDAVKELRGTYVHPKLINFIAEWISIEYAFKVAHIMDMINERQHALQLEAEENYKEIINKLSQEIEDNKNKINNLTIKLNNHVSRSVPENTDKDYKFMIYIDDDFNDNEFIKLNFVRRHKKYWSPELRDISESVACIVYEDSMPISMTVNHKIKEAIKKNLDEDDYKFIGGSGSIIVRPGIEEEIRELASQVLDSFRE